MSPMPDFPDSVENSERDQNLNIDDASHAYDRKISVSEAEKSKLSIFECNDSKSSDTIKVRTEKNTLTRENSVDTLASTSLNHIRNHKLMNHRIFLVSLQAVCYHIA